MNHVLLTPEAEPVPLGRPHPVSYPVSYITRTRLHYFNSAVFMVFVIDCKN